MKPSSNIFCNILDQKKWLSEFQTCNGIAGFYGLSVTNAYPIKPEKLECDTGC